LLASELAETVATTSRDVQQWQATPMPCFNKQDGVMPYLLKPSLMTEAETCNSYRQKRRCCKTKNPTILGERVRGWTVAGPVQWLWLVASFHID